MWMESSQHLAHKSAVWGRCERPLWLLFTVRHLGSCELLSWSSGYPQLDAPQLLQRQLLLHTGGERALVWYLWGGRSALRDGSRRTESTLPLDFPLSSQYFLHGFVAVIRSEPLSLGNIEDHSVVHFLLHPVNTFTKQRQTGGA